MSRNVSREVREFIVSNFLYGRELALQENDSFLEQGVIDSTGVLQLVSFLEETYGITVEDEDLTPENLDSLRSVAAFVNRKLGAGTADAVTESASGGAKV